jgi:tetratricopeptide (TPR) repeat protein
LVCLDTETTGLGTATGTVPFLVGLGSWEEERLVVRQLVLPDHSDERAFLDILERTIPRDAWLVTYNGRTFDWPLVTTRYRLHGRAAPPTAGHLDLLTLARQVWRHRLDDARLASVEAAVAGVRRDRDLNGAMIPERYFAWLRTGRGEWLQDVLKHNRQDVVSLAHLLHTIAGALLPAGRPGSGELQDSVHPGDLAGLGRAFARRGRHEDALTYLEASLERLPPWASRELQDRVSAERARVLARLGRPEEAAAAWEAVALDGGPGAALAWIQVAKAREHAQRDHAAALQAAKMADAIASRRRLLGDPDRLVERDLVRRLPRLRRLLADPRAGLPMAPGARTPKPAVARSDPGPSG